MTASVSAQDQISSLMAEAMPQQILEFKFSAAIQERILVLVERKKAGQINEKEADELNHYLMYDLLVGLAKARAFEKMKT